MSQEYDNTNRGTLFLETNKFSKNSPDYSGVFNLNGVDVKIVGWNRQTKTGRDIISLAIRQVKSEPAKPAKA